MDEPVLLKAVVRGRVQGVYFRAFVQSQANRLGLTGYVRNLPGGSVEVVAEGSRGKLEELAGWLKEGSPASRVEEVVVAWAEYGGDYRDFTIEY